jgi:hypothetical protein
MTNSISVGFINLVMISWNVNEWMNSNATSGSKLWGWDPDWTDSRLSLVVQALVLSMLDSQKGSLSFLHQDINCYIWLQCWPWLYVEYRIIEDTINENRPAIH